MPRRISLVSVVVGAALALVVLGPGARAQVPPLPPLPTASPTPSPSPSPTSSPKPKTSSTPRPKPKPTATQPPQGPAPTPYSGQMREALEYVRSLQRTPARSTQRLLDLLLRVQPAGTQLTQQAMVRGFGRFPVVGYVWYQDDWAAPRYTPYFHLHEGIDLFAVAGTPVIASADGVIAKVANGSIGGISFWLDGDDGITYYYGHLKGYASGVAAGRRVRLGDVLGFVGDSGVAQGTYPHLHFEIHPLGGLPINPKPIVDAWLTQAEANAINAYRRLVEYNALSRIGAARWQAIFDLLRAPAASAPALWPAALDPWASSLALETALDRLAWSLDPASLAGSAAGPEASLVAQAVEAATGGPAWLDPAGAALAAPSGPFLTAAR